MVIAKYMKNVRLNLINEQEIEKLCVAHYYTYFNIKMFKIILLKTR